jgi:predicted GIY-YIG superfamily endonuclease
MEGYYYVYVLQNIIKNFVYVGMCSKLIRRFSQHNDGQVHSTKAYRPLELKLFICVPSRLMARKLEKYLKVGSGKTILKRRLIGEGCISFESLVNEMKCS